MTACIPESMLKTLNTGITIRNKIVHGSKQEIDLGTLEKVLRVIRDLLYLLDYYCGHSWALKNVSIETMREFEAKSSER